MYYNSKYKIKRCKMKKIILLCLLTFSLFASQSEFAKDNVKHKVDDMNYVIRCIEGYKWIQFIYVGVGRGTNYFSNGNPIQMFEEKNNTNISTPIKCK